MLTADQIRLRIQNLRMQPHEASSWDLLNLLEEILPALLEEHAAIRLSQASRGVPYAESDAGRRYSGVVGRD